MFWRKLLHAIEHKRQLRIHRLLNPQRPIVIERSNPLINGDEVGASLLRHFLDERDNGLLRSTIVPRRQRILRPRTDQRHRNKPCANISLQPTDSRHHESLPRALLPRQTAIHRYCKNSSKSHLSTVTVE